MNKYTEATYQLIEDFLNKQLPSDKANAVQKRIQKDAAFAKEVEWMRSFSSTVEALGDKKKIEVLDAFREIHTTSTDAPAVNKATTGKPLLWVSLLLIPLLLAGLIWFAYPIKNVQQDVPAQELQPASQELQPNKSNPQEIIPQEEKVPPVATAEPEKIIPPKKKKVEQGQTTKKEPKKSVPPPAPPIAELQKPKPFAQNQPTIPWEQYVTYMKGGQYLSGDETTLNRGLILMGKGEPKAALPHFEEHLASEEGEEDFEIQLETGKIYLEAFKNIDKALPIFQQIQASDATAEFTQKADFYIAICYLAKGDISSSKIQLQKIIAEEGHAWQEKAASLLAKLGY